MSVAPATAARLLRATAATRARRAQERALRLRARLPDAAEALRSLGAQEVWLFGSLLHGDVHEASDIDLAVGGMSPEAYVAALGWMSANVPCPVDLVRLEDAAPAFGERVRREGARL